MQRIENIVKILDAKKAEDIQFFDMRKDEYFVDFVILATTLGEKHALWLVEELKSVLENENFQNIDASDEWVAVDLGDIVIHLLTSSCRAKYNIEELLEKIKFRKFSN